MIEVGDLVRFKEWEDMAEEFGTDSDGCIRCAFCFTQEMRELCGKEFVVTHITNYGDLEGHHSGFSVSTDMVEKVYDTDFDPSEELDLFLSGYTLLEGTE